MTYVAEDVVVVNFDFKRFQSDGTLVIGKVLSCEKSDTDYSYHGTPWYPEITKVLGDDGKEYFSFYSSRIKGDSFIKLTQFDDYIIKPFRERLEQDSKSLDDLENKIKSILEKNYK